MKAIVYTKFGSPEVLHLEDVEKPEPKNNEVLIRIKATSVVKEDPDMRSTPGFNGLFKPAHPILGQELAGVIEAVGCQVRRFKPGDEVYGFDLFGAYAEYKCMPENAALAKKPVNLTFEEAAVIPNGALTALPYLRERGKIKRGQRVLIYGASGSVGSAAVQLAKYFGAKVTAVCSTSNMEWVRMLGADQVIDYLKEGFTLLGQTYDIIFDTVGKLSFSTCKSSLTADGIYLSTGPSLDILLQMALPVNRSGKKALMMAAGLRPAKLKAAELEFLTGLIEAGQFKPVIDRVYTLEDMAEAHRYVALGHKKGNVAVRITSGSVNEERKAA